MGDLDLLEKRPKRAEDLLEPALRGFESFVVRSVKLIGSTEGRFRNLLVSLGSVWEGRTAPEATVVGPGDGKREGLAEKVEALDGERPSTVLPTNAPSFFEAAFSDDSRRLCPVVNKRLRLLCITGEGAM